MSGGCRTHDRCPMAPRGCGRRSRRPQGVGSSGVKCIPRYGKYEAVGGVINASPAGDGKTSYYIAPGAFIGNWSARRALVFDKKSWGGSYYGPDSYAAYGDVVIKSGNKSARYDIDADHSGNWRTYRISLSDRGWKFPAGPAHWPTLCPSGYALHSRLPHILWLAGPPAA